MKIRARVRISGNGLDIGAGVEAVIDDGAAISLINGGFAVPINDNRIEKAVVAPPDEVRKPKKTVRKR